MKTRFLRAAIIAICMICILSLASCDLLGTAETTASTTGDPAGTKAPGTEAPGTEAPGTEVPGTEAPETAPAEPLPERTAEELLKMLVNYLEKLGDRNMELKMTVVNDGAGWNSQEEMKGTTEYLYSVAVNGFDTDDFGMILRRSAHIVVEHSDGTKEENTAKEEAIVVGGMGYVKMTSGDIERLQKLPVTKEVALEETEMIPTRVFCVAFSDGLKTNVTVGENSYTLTVTGLDEKEFWNLFIRHTPDESQGYIYDPASGYSMTAEIGRDGNVISATLTSKFTRRIDNAENSMNYTTTTNAELSFSNEIPVITAPENADEYEDVSQPKPPENTQAPVATTAPGTDSPEPETPETLPAEPSAEEIYALVKYYFTCDGNPTYTMSQTTQHTLDGSTAEDRYVMFLGMLNFGTDNVRYYEEHIYADGEVNRFIFCGDGYVYGYSQSPDGKEIKLKMEMTSDQVNKTMSESCAPNGFEFEFSDFSSVTLRYENGQYILEIQGLSEKAYIKNILGYSIVDDDDRNGVIMGMVRQYYEYDAESFTASIVVDNTGRLVSVEYNTEYVLNGDPDAGVEPGRHEYAKKYEISAINGLEIFVPEDADRYEVVDSF